MGNIFAPTIIVRVRLKQSNKKVTNVMHKSFRTIFHLYELVHSCARTRYVKRVGPTWLGSTQALPYRDLRCHSPLFTPEPWQKSRRYCHNNSQGWLYFHRQAAFLLMSLHSIQEHFVNHCFDQKVRLYLNDHQPERKWNAGKVSVYYRWIFRYLRYVRKSIHKSNNLKYN